MRSKIGNLIKAFKTIPFLVVIISSPSFSASNDSQEYIEWSKVKQTINNSLLKERDDYSDKVSSMTMGIPFLYFSSCSAFLAKHPISSEILAVTALHCIRNPENFKNTTRDGGSIMGIQAPSNNTFSIGGKFEYEYSEILDLFASKTKLDKNMDMSRVFEVADTLPKRGDLVFIEGYKGVSVPLVAQWTSLMRVSCVYMGKVFDNHNLNNRKSDVLKSSIFDYLYCPEDLVGPGISGGPIIDQNGKLLGVLSRGIEKSRVLGMDHSVYYFSSMTKSEYDSSNENHLLPIKNGDYEYYNLNFLSPILESRKNGKYKIAAYTSYKMGVSFKDSLLNDVAVERSTNNFPIAFHWFVNGEICRTKIIGEDMVYGRIIYKDDKHKKDNFDCEESE